MLYSYLEEDFNPIEFGRVSKQFYVYVKDVKVFVDYEVFKVYLSEIYKNKNKYKKMKKYNIVLTRLSDLSIKEIQTSRKEISQIDKVTIEMAIAKLSPAEQKLVYSIYYYGYTQQQVADKLGISQSTINYRLKNILYKLRCNLCAS